jgi:hypothetical protein
MTRITEPRDFAKQALPLNKWQISYFCYRVSRFSRCGICAWVLTLLLMRVVGGSALVVRAGLTLRSDLPPMNVTIPAILLLGAGILLIAGLWTPVAGISVALTEVWKMLMLPGDKPLWLMLGTAGAALAMLGPGLWSIDASRLWLEAPRTHTSQEEL